MNMGGRNSGELGSGKSGKMRLKKLRKREDMSTIMVEEEDYHTGLSASVPFQWESEPGTPKANLNDRNSRSLLSPLTPPPSYFSNHLIINSSPMIHLSSKPSFNKPSFLNTVFRKLSVKPSTLQPPSPASSSSSSSTMERRRYASPRRLSFDSRVDDDDDDENEDGNLESPVSTLFFGRRSDKGCYPKLVKVFTRYSK
ncbi:uncharacterized protein LOC101203250 [Cucumis sativus]|uniref:Uncharacterized protein n=1 Tax=Cucumis sativus TaxID=3659 RepID=A0A0A0LYC9_CUCSA|nr:uncharacterized protein LOC101203250 [Cucumis sativus]KGN65857.1 hypothetical protein Csa_023180 [Cucumis sativus]